MRSKNKIKIPWDKWKRKHNESKYMGHTESRSKCEIHNNTDLPQEMRKVLNKHSNLTCTGTRKKQKTKNWVSKNSSGRTAPELGSLDCS